MRKHLRRLRGVSLTQWIFLSLVAGFAIGVLTPSWVPYLKPFRGLFLQGIKCIVAPLIFSTLVTGIAGAGSFRQLGLMGVRALVYFEAATTAALAVGLVAVNLLHPGVGVNLAGTQADPTLQFAASTKITFGSFISHLLPSSLADAMVRGDVLQIVIFSTIFAFGVLAVGEKARPLVQVCEALAEVMFKFTGYIMCLAPLGVGAALAASVAENGWHVIVPLLKLVGSLYLALAAFVACVLWPVCRYFKIPVRSFIARIKEPVWLAFATASSESAFPLAMERLEEFGIPRRITSFVLPLGYSFNLDGSTLYLALASVFIAQAAGIKLGLGTQLAMMLTLMLTTKGVAAVPRASLVVLSGTVASFGLPLEGVAFILGVDTFMDMARTAVNLLGNCLATTVVARCEGIELESEAARLAREAFDSFMVGEAGADRPLPPLEEALWQTDAIAFDLGQTDWRDRPYV